MSICLLGYFLGDAFPTLGESIDKLVIVIVAFSLVPIVVEWWRHRRTSAAGAEIGHARRRPRPRHHRPRPRLTVVRTASAAYGVELGAGEHRADLQADVGERVLPRG